MNKLLKYLITLRYIKLLAYISAKYLQITREESHKHRYTYYYGFQIIYGTINKFLLLIVLGLLLHILPQIILVTLSFAILRVWSGGLHFNSYTKCAYLSLFGFAIMGLLSKYVLLNNIASIIIFLFVLLMFLIYAPIENENRPLTNKEKKKFKIIAISLLVILFIVCNLISNIIIVNSIMYGILLSGIIVMPMVNKLK